MDKKDELKHYGVLGMKWGVRRYQPYPKGQGHKGKFVGNASNLRKSKTKNVKTQVDSARSIIRDTQSTHKTIMDIKKDKKPMPDLTSLSDKELRERVNRLNMEMQYRNLTSSDMSKGDRYIKDTLTIAGNVLGAASSALMIALAIKKLKG